MWNEARSSMSTNLTNNGNLLVGLSARRFFFEEFRVRKFDHKDLLGIGQLCVEDIGLILDTAVSLKEISTRDIKKGPHP